MKTSPINTRHGHASPNPSPTYRSWSMMKARCLNPNSTDFRNYGARGITVCERWLTFDNFLADMGERPAGTTLDRKENTAGYCKENCCWSTRTQQDQNKRTNRLVDFKGQRIPLVAVANQSGIPYQTLYFRVVVWKWPVERAVSEPIRTKHIPRNLIAKHSKV